MINLLAQIIVFYNATFVCLGPGYKIEACVFKD